jgi:cell division protease FtsH
LVIAKGHETARPVLELHREQLDMTAEILVRRETIEREQFIELLDGKSEDEVFLDASAPGRSSEHTARRRNGRRRAARPRSDGQPASARTLA